MSSEEAIETGLEAPSLKFTKAELVYLVAVLTADLSPGDNFTRIEMTEVRHYLNLIKEKVSLAASDGTLHRALTATKDIPNPSAKEEAEAAKKEDETAVPPMEKLRMQFPNLTDSEIREILESAKEEKAKEAIGADEVKPLKLTGRETFSGEKGSPPQHTTRKDKQKKENSERFAMLLGA